MGTVRIPLGGSKHRDLFFLIDEEDYERVSQHRWHLTAGYPATTIKRVEVYLHRFLLDAPRGTAIDHRNRDKLDARRANLRFATPSENACNKAGASVRQHPYKGVEYDHRDGKWYPRAQVNGERPSLGAYETAEEAARIYDAVARFYHGEFACTNFPEGETLTVEAVRERMKERRKAHTSSRFVGVTYDARYRHPWRINVTKHGTSIYRLRFATEEEAAEAYARLKEEVEGEQRGVYATQRL